MPGGDLSIQVKEDFQSDHGRPVEEIALETSKQIRGPAFSQGGAIGKRRDLFPRRCSFKELKQFRP